MKCTKCGHEGSRAEFKYMGPMESGFRKSIRRCPQCNQLTECDEMAEDEVVGDAGAWGLKALGKKIQKGVKNDGDL